MQNNTEPLTSAEPVYSFHAFLFPFRWEYQGGEEKLFEEQTDLKKLIHWMVGDNKWERRSSWVKANSLAQFNEVAYFYDFVRPVLYDTGDEKSLQAHYYYNLPSEQAEYVIQLKDDKSYRLAIDDIVVSYYNNGVGILAFHLLNKEKKQSSPDDILKINYFGRRVYPPFLSTDVYNKAGTQAFFEDQDWEAGLNRTIYASGELAVAIRLKSGDTVWGDEDFLHWIKDQNLDRAPHLIEQLFPTSLAHKVSTQPVLDDRMYTVCWYGDNSRSQAVKGTMPTTSYQENEWWYRYVFVDDSEPSCANDGMMQNLLKRATYDRWAGNATFYGISRYSFVALTDDMKSGFFPRLVLTHVQTLYYKLSLLCLVQRACLLRFSEEITAISQMDKSEKQIGARIGSLYKQYLRFVNKIYFREVTAQEQGIELYQMLQQQMGLPEQVTALQQEMQELHQYALIVEEEQRNDKLDLLTYIGAFFVVPSFVGTYFGIADYDLKGEWEWISFFCILSALFAFGAIRSSGKQRIVWIILLALLMLGMIVIFPQFDIWSPAKS